MALVTPRSHPVVIYQGEDLEHLTELRQAAERARRLVRQHESGDARHGDAPSAEAEELAYNEAVAAAAERAVIVTVQAIGRKQFRNLMLEHPVRKVPWTYTRASGEEVTEQVTNPEDGDFGVNTVTFSLALLTYVDPENSDRRTITEPDFAKRTDLVDFLENDIADGQFEELWLTAWSLNRSGGADPKATLYTTGSPTTT